MGIEHSTSAEIGDLSKTPERVEPDSATASLIAAIAAMSPLLQAEAAAADTLGRLSQNSVHALQEHGIWRMRLCRELGGFELSIVDQIRVLAALAAEDAASAWCTMVAGSAVAMLGATMPPAAISRIFTGTVPACTIVGAPGGFATPAKGGYMLTGTWRQASAIHHASWVYLTAHIERDPSRLLSLAIPAGDVEVLPTWNAAGLAATGSNDFKLTDYFVPFELAGLEGAPDRQVRGTRRYDLLEIEYVQSYEHLAFAVGTGRRALAELRMVLARPAAARHGADREVVRRQLGQAVVRLQAVEAMAVALYTRVDAAALGQQQNWAPADRHLPRALAVYATEIALECVHLAFQRAIAVSLQRPNIFEKLLRDMSVAATHVAVEDTAYASYAQDLIETGAPMTFADAVDASKLAG